MGDSDPTDVPDLDLPAKPRANAPYAAPVGSAPELGAPPALSLSASGSAPPKVALDLGGLDDFDMEIERGGSLVSLPPAQSPRLSGGPASVGRQPVASAGALEMDRGVGAGARLEIAYTRPDARRHVAIVEPSTAEKLGAFVITAGACVGTIALLFKLVHRRGGWSPMALAPHAFDATSTVQSGAFVVVALILGIALGFMGFRARPRSYAIVASGSMLLVASLAMVTVTLVSTEEQPSPPDGALLIPYLIPLALLLLGAALVRRGPLRFYEGGVRRTLTVVYGALGGALLFAAIEISALASRLP